MVELTAFGYLPGNSVVHHLDVRVKVIGMLGVSAVGLQTAPLGVLVLGLALGVVMAHLKLPLGTLVRQLKLFGFLLLVLSSLVVWLRLKLTRQNLKKVVQ